jgi:hypothetical protein
MTEKESDILSDVRRIRHTTLNLLSFIDHILDKYENPVEARPQTHNNPPAEAEKLVFYMQEVLNKCAKRSPKANHPKQNFLKAIAKQVPRYLIMQALGAMQDARQQNLNPETKYIKNLDAYFFNTLRNMCEEHKIITDMNWGK